MSDADSQRNLGRLSSKTPLPPPDNNNFNLPSPIGGGDNEDRPVPLVWPAPPPPAPPTPFLPFQEPQQPTVLSSREIKQLASQVVGEQEEVLGKKVSDHNIAKTFPRAEYILNEKEKNIVQIDKTIFLDKFEDITNVILNPLTKVLVEEKSQGIGIFFQGEKNNLFGKRLQELDEVK